jgi:hypothetical protein
MSGKVKMRCARCGKPFKSNNARQTLCTECAAKERGARAAATKTVPVAQTPAIKPKIVGAGAHILDPSLPPLPQPEPPRAAPARPFERRPETYSPPVAAMAPVHPTHNGATAMSATPQQSHPPAWRPPSAGQKDQKEKSRTSRPPKNSKLPREPQKPFELAPAQRAAIEARYLELATPVEFDGIRTQIAAELNVPKSVVKKAVLELRQTMQMPSWWELQAYKGSEADLERIRQAYTPRLPLPDVGVHKAIAATLGLDAASVYQAIRRIRAELRLPQYNPPELRPPAPSQEPPGAAGAPAHASDAAPNMH